MDLERCLSLVRCEQRTPGRADAGLVEWLCEIKGDILLLFLPVRLFPALCDPRPSRAGPLVWLGLVPGYLTPLDSVEPSGPPKFPRDPHRPRPTPGLTRLQEKQ